MKEVKAFRYFQVSAKTGAIPRTYLKRSVWCVRSKIRGLASYINQQYYKHERLGIMLKGSSGSFEVIPFENVKFYFSTSFHV